MTKARQLALAVAIFVGLAAPTSMHMPKASNIVPNDLFCLAKNIYYEARGESIQGQQAVAQVTINRTKAPGFPSSICSVVYQHKQFSWTLNKRRQITDLVAWDRSLRIARQVLLGQVPELDTFKALYFHTKQVRPYWRRNKVVYAKIGNHIFY